MLDEIKIYDVFVDHNLVIREREATIIKKEGKVLSRIYTDSRLVAPGQSTGDLQDATKKIVAAVHTADVVQRYQEKTTMAEVAEQGAEVDTKE